MGRTVVRVGAVLVVCWLALVAGASAGWAFGSVRPVPGPVVRGYDPPEPNWLAGHRGVDLGASVGSEVRVAAPGRVSVAQVIAGRGVVTVVHGELRTSYEPVKATVRVGDQVQAGDVIGLLEAGHCPAGCLHFGLKRGAEYLDPLGDSEVRLLPESAVALARRLAAERAAAPSGGIEPPGSGVLLNPVGGRISSPQIAQRPYHTSSRKMSCPRRKRVFASGMLPSFAAGICQCSICCTPLLWLI